jgi:transposase InsO family protein
MQQINLSYKNKLYKAVKYIDKAASITNVVAQKRLKAVSFYQEHGLKATLDAFDISRATLMRWQRSYRQYGQRGLIPMSRKPYKIRQSNIPSAVVKFVLEYRYKHPRVCQYTIKPLLDKYCKEHNYGIISTSSIERIIRKLKEEGKMPDNKQFSLHARSGNIKPKHKLPFKKLRRGKYMPTVAGDIMQIDSVHLVSDGIKKYLITAIDLKSRFAHSEVYGSLNSLNAKDFMQKLEHITPFKINRIQTDNGLEFGKYFAEHVREQEVIHYHNYPKCPKSNAYIERFNRTIREQFVQCSPYAPGSEEFKKELADYIIWYNTERVHKGLKYITPMEYILSRPTAQIQVVQKSHMY